MNQIGQKQLTIHLHHREELQAFSYKYLHEIRLPWTLVLNF